MSEAQSATPPGGASSPGEALRRAREARSLTVAEVAEALKLRPRQIEAIENGDFASFKGLAFARGFVRNYARLLATDPAPLLAAMSEVAPGGAVRLTPPSNAQGEMPRGAAVRGVPRSVALVALAALAAVILAMFYDRLAPMGGEPRPGAPSQPASVAQPAPPPDAAPVPALAPARSAADGAAAELQAASPTPPPASTAHAAASLTPAAESPVPRPEAAARIELRFARPSWVEITDATGRVLYSRTGTAGGSATLEGSPPLSVWIGNAGAVQVKYRDRPVDLAPHTSRNVARLRLE